MPFNKEKRSKEASVRPRDRSGHFIPLKPKVKVSGQANLLADLVKTEDGDDKGSSWINLTINHPFRKMIEVLQQIKEKQSTTVALRFTIPLIALPIAILMAFQFGRYQSSCTSYFSSQSGILQNITITKSVSPDNFFLKALNYLPYLSEIYNKEEIFTQSILVKDNSETIIINNEAGADIGRFTLSKVIIFGNYDSCTKTLSLESDRNITSP